MTDRSAPGVRARLEVEHLSAWYGRGAGVTEESARSVVADVSLTFPDRQVTAVVGPSGCGKSTLLRCLNRVHETAPGARVRGAVYLDGENVYARAADVASLRRRVGMVFARPTPFPARSVRENVLAAAWRARGGSARARRESGESAARRALERVGLWDELRDRLDDEATLLSGGQQQRLCIARALAAEPDVLLLDEPTTALDPLSAQRVEELVYALRAEITVVFVTHNLQQAARMSDVTAFLLDGRVVEYGPTDQLFTAPSDPRTEAYVTGRFG